VIASEPKLKPSEINDKAIHKKSRETPRGGDWKHWFHIPFFYQAGIIYMCTRITLNVSQVFMPFYLQESLNLKDSNGTAIAEVPLVMMVVSFVVSFFLKRANKHFGRRLVFVIGSLITGGGIATIYFTPQVFFPDRKMPFQFHSLLTYVDHHVNLSNDTRICGR